MAESKRAEEAETHATRFNPIAPLSRALSRLVGRYLPDPLVFAILLTLITFGLGVWLTPAGPLDMVYMWGGGFWNLLAFHHADGADPGYRPRDGQLRAGAQGDEPPCLVGANPAAGSDAGCLLLRHRLRRQLGLRPGRGRHVRPRGLAAHSESRLPAVDRFGLHRLHDMARRLLRVGAAGRRHQGQPDGEDHRPDSDHRHAVHDLQHRNHAGADPGAAVRLPGHASGAERRDRRRSQPARPRADDAPPARSGRHAGGANRRGAAAVVHRRGDGHRLSLPLLPRQRA